MSRKLVGFCAEDDFVDALDSAVAVFRRNNSTITTTRASFLRHAALRAMENEGVSFGRLKPREAVKTPSLLSSDTGVTRAAEA